MRTLEAIRQAGAIVQEIILAPLACEDLGRLIADSLYCDRSASLRWRNWSTRRLLAIHFSPFSLFMRLPRRLYSPSIMAMRDGPGT